MARHECTYHVLQGRCAWQKAFHMCYKGIALRAAEQVAGLADNPLGAFQDSAASRGEPWALGPCSRWAQVVREKLPWHLGKGKTRSSGLNNATALNRAVSFVGQFEPEVAEAAAGVAAAAGQDAVVAVRA